RKSWSTPFLRPMAAFCMSAAVPCSFAVRKHALAISNSGTAATPSCTLNGRRSRFPSAITLCSIANARAWSGGFAHWLTGVAHSAGTSFAALATLFGPCSQQMPEAGVLCGKADRAVGAGADERLIGVDDELLDAPVGVSELEGEH